MNGQFVDEDGPQISLRDTGLLHGAGAVTTMRAKEGKVFRLARHFQRLRRSCEELLIPLQYSDGELEAAVMGAMGRNNLSDARLRVTVTRGQARADVKQGMVLTPNCFVTATELQPYPASFYAQGMSVVVEDEQKLNPYDIQAGHKTLNYQSRLASMREAARGGAGEALWFNVHNFLQSGSISNVFMVKDGVLVTPPTNDDLLIPSVAAACPYKRSNVLPGVMRGAVLEIALKNKLPVRLEAISIEMLLEADEVFLTNSIMQVMPVGRVEKHEFGEGGGGAGEVTERMMGWVGEEVEEGR